MDPVPLHHQISGDGPPLVLVHGFTGSSLDWTDVAPALAADHTVVTLDQRGHGDSPHTGGEETYSFDALVGDLTALVGLLDLDRFDLLGHSMGGVVAMRFASVNPERLRSLILMDTAPRPATGMTEAMTAGIELVRRQGTASLIGMFQSVLGPDARGAEIGARIATKLTQMDPAAFAALGEELLSYPSELEAVAALDLPVTVIVGEDDVGLRPGAAELVATIPGAHLEVVAGAGHSPQEDDPQRWLAALGRHFERVAVSRAR